MDKTLCRIIYVLLKHQYKKIKLNRTYITLLILEVVNTFSGSRRTNVST